MEELLIHSKRRRGKNTSGKNFALLSNESSVITANPLLARIRSEHHYVAKTAFIRLLSFENSELLRLKLFLEDYGCDYDLFDGELLTFEMGRILHSPLRPRPPYASSSPYLPFQVNVESWKRLELFLDRESASYRTTSGSISRGATWIWGFS